MSGTTVHRPRRKHVCSPGWTWKPSSGEGFPTLPAGTMCGVPPTPYEYPVGTVWQCECGQTWVSGGSPAVNMPGVCTWRREGRWERRRRERKSSLLP